MTHLSDDFTTTRHLPDYEQGRRVRVILSQWHVTLEEQQPQGCLTDAYPRLPLTRMVLSREQLLAFLVALPEPYLQAALRVQAGDPDPFTPLKEQQ